MSPSRREVVVLGGGPAGASAANLLARLGHDVVLITRPAPPAEWLAESIPGSARKLLERVGILEAVLQVGFVPYEGNTVWWAGRAERTERFPPEGVGVQADRGRLEAAMLSCARTSGVDVRTTGPVRNLHETDDGWRVESTGEAIRSRWLLDASGRAGVLARRELRLRERRTATLALIGYWECASGWGEAESGLTFVESYEDGWAWSVPLSATRRCVTAMVDPRRTALERSASLTAMYRAEIGKAGNLSGRLAPGRPVGPVRACPASLYGARQYGRLRALLVGDAGSCIDPLSSYGVKKALSSGWLAAVTTHTALTEPERGSLAVEFYDDHEREVYRTYRGRSIPFLEEALEAHGHDFWRVRAETARTASGSVSGVAGASGNTRADSTSWGSEAPDEAVGAIGVDARAEAFLGDPAVEAAFEDIRRRPRIDLRPATSMRKREGAAIVGNLIALEPRLSSPVLPGGVRFIRRVDVRRLVELAPHSSHVPDLFEAYNAGRPPAELHDFLAALAFSVGAGFLEHADAPA